MVPHFDVSKADLILDFGSDFLDAGPSPVEAARQFAEAQDIHEHPAGGARLVSIGPRLSMTASNADQWVACSAGSEGLLAAVLARAVFDRAKAQGRSIRGDEAAIASALRRIDRKGAAARAGIDAEVLDGLVDRLLAAGHQVVLVGQAPPFGSNPVHCLARSHETFLNVSCTLPARVVKERLTDSNELLRELADGNSMGAANPPSPAASRPPEN